ncbi:endo-1,4-beta-xylanase [Antarcticibacterium sp. 1MA-6-2]|uniref:endo-1,4-beta-xylanase n=1 Tax=Antarcticibacterium sp. 1MA-6-2 TaxID=2908210 RepID=UPI001F3510CD|nr:endo-1,4-beta-xylanase [Antarcticibacterium sp. 1MA-6-2]UJH90661.1 endo-1,4-beta-xylanase [Antarcticibacterium sp. 1MA-6-2]
MEPLQLIKKSAYLLLPILLFTACKNQSEKDEQDPIAQEKQQEKGLKDYFSEYFPMGVAVAPRTVEGKSAELIMAEFNSITPENVMKMGPIHPEKDRFFWEDADKIAAFAEDNGLKMRGHALVWHQQTGGWIFEDENGNDVDREELLKRMKTHIDSVVGRYKGIIYAWDVVNEAISDNPDELLRKSKWLEIIGEDFIAKAFEYARAADPDARIFYNDYNAIIPEKRDRIYKMLKNLVDNDVPIDGVGIQGHWSIHGPSEEELRKAMEMYSSLGLYVQITELDVSLYPWEKEQRELTVEDNDDFTPELEQRQVEAYKMFFEVFRDYKDGLTGVTFWNLSDQYSWLDHYPVEGRKNYPLLFDENMQRKKVYYEVINFGNEENVEEE